MNTAKDWLRREFTANGHERAYARVSRAVYAEELLCGEAGGLPPDYKVFVFCGKVRMVQVDRDRFARHDDRGRRTVGRERGFRSRRPLGDCRQAILRRTNDVTEQGLKPI